MNKVSEMFYKYRVPFGMIPIALGIGFSLFEKAHPYGNIAVVAGLGILLLGVLFRFWVASYNWVNIASNLPEAGTGLLTRGPYRIVRNPVYLSMIIMTIGFSCLFQSIVVFIIMVLPTIFIHLWQIRYEEKYLQNKFGNNFMAYKKAVPALVPWKITDFNSFPANGKPNWKAGLKSDFGPIFGGMTFLIVCPIIFIFGDKNVKYLMLSILVTVLLNGVFVAFFKKKTVTE